MASKSRLVCDAAAPPAPIASAAVCSRRRRVAWGQPPVPPRALTRAAEGSGPPGGERPARSRSGGRRGRPSARLVSHSPGAVTMSETVARSPASGVRPPQFARYFLPDMSESLPPDSPPGARSHRARLRALSLWSVSPKLHPAQFGRAHRGSPRPPGRAQRPWETPAVQGDGRAAGARVCARVSASRKHTERLSFTSAGRTWRRVCREGFSVFSEAFYRERFSFLYPRESRQRVGREGDARGPGTRGFASR